MRARRAEGAEHPAAAHQGQPAPGLDSRLEQVLNFPTLEALRIDTVEHQLVYSVTYKGKPLVENSNLQLVLQSARPLGSDVRITGQTPSQ